MSLESFVRNVVTAEPRTSLANVARLMKQNNVGAIVITEQDRPVGMVTDRDLAMATCVCGVSPEEPVQSVMMCPVSTIREDEDILDATQQMMQLAVRRLPVVDPFGRLVGIVSLDDLLLLMSRELQNLGEGIRAKIAVE